MKKRAISRRTFIRGGVVTLGGAVAGVGGAMFIPRHVLAGAMGKLNVACIGCGGKGHSDTMAVRGENIVALCDVDQKNAGKVLGEFPKAKKYTDYRKMFDEMGDEIDAVTVSTPDHNHFPAAMMAIMRGKHVFCQKPLTHNIWEARALTLAARKHKVATQMGIQGHSNEGARLLVEWVRGGLIGPVREVHYWTNRPVWPQGINRPGDTPTVPSTLDWDSWLGPAPERPYHQAYLPFRWRGWWDYGCGALGDIGCHAFDAAFWALELGHATSVVAETSPVNDETAPRWSIVTYQFPARGSKPPVKVVWYDGNRKPPRPKDLEENRKLNPGIGGQLLFGETGTIMAGIYCGGPRVIPESRMRELRKSLPPKTLQRSPGHVTEWIRACKGGSPAGANFDFAGPLTEMVLMGNLAVRTGKPIAWDGPNMQVTNFPEAGRYVRRKPREGWIEPYRYGEKLVQPKKARASRKKRERPARRATSEEDVAEKKAEQLFRMARQAERMRQRDAAASLYSKIVDDYPDTSFAKRAAEMLKKLKR